MNIQSHYPTNAAPDNEAGTARENTKLDEMLLFRSEKVERVEPTLQLADILIEGFVEFVAPTRIEGWAFSAHLPEGHMSITVYDGDTVIGTGIANTFRKDLENSGLGSGNHGFSIKLNKPLSGGGMSQPQVIANVGDLPRHELLWLPSATAHMGAMKSPELEAVRLVIWDLDETFWRGTLTEGGIEYLTAHHDIVVELAERGIISSICSKNDSDPVINLLRQNDILEYFVFPSIAWSAKGPRISALIDSFQLRPQTVMFIDDNPSNRGEAAVMVPGLQVETELFIPNLLNDRRFKGKDDKTLSRLKQYKLLETRANDALNVEGSNEDFLRSCDIRVFIDYDIQSNVDRAIELINRTNQLNFTKIRLPEDVGAAREQLIAECQQFDRQVGLVRVRDKYGDYGYVGFFLLLSDLDKSNFIAGPQWIGGDKHTFRRLLHFCFSCRTLGMLIERWVYDYLGRPRLLVSGEVLTDLQAPVELDWVHLVPSMSDKVDAIQAICPEIRLFGGCEMHALSVYLEARSKVVCSTGNFTANGVFYRINSAVFAASHFNRVSAELREEIEYFGGPFELLQGDFFSSAAPGAVFIFGPGLDAERRAPLRHTKHGWELFLSLKTCEDLDIVNATEKDVSARLDTDLAMPDVYRDNIQRVARHLRENYQNQKPLTDAQTEAAILTLVNGVPAGGRLVFLLDHTRLRPSDGIVRDDPPRIFYNKMVENVIRPYPFTVALSFSAVVTSDDQVQMHGNHYDRVVYLGMAEKIVECIKSLPVRGFS